MRFFIGYRNLGSNFFFNFYCDISTWINNYLYFLFFSYWARFSPKSV